MQIAIPPKISPWLILWLAFLLNFVAQAAHECGHWMVYQLGGHAPTWGFTRLVQTDHTPRQPDEWVSVTYTDGDVGWLRLKSKPTAWAEQVMAAAGGPLASLLVAGLGLTLTYCSNQSRWQLSGLVLLLTLSFAMGAYYLRSPMRTGGDEAEIAALLGIPKILLDIPLGLAYLTCLGLGLRQVTAWRTRLGWLGLIIFASMIGGILMMQTDLLITAQVDLGNPLFQSVFGYSLPVLLFHGLVLFAIWLTFVKWLPTSRITEHATP